MMEAKLLQSRPASTTSSSQGEDGCLEVEDSVNSDIGDDEMIVWEDQHIQHKDCFSTYSSTPPPIDYERLAAKLAGLVESKLLEGFGERLAGIERALTTQLQPLFEKLEAERLERERLKRLDAASECVAEENRREQLEARDEDEEERPLRRVVEEEQQHGQIIQRQAPPQKKDSNIRSALREEEYRQQHAAAAVEQESLMQLQLEQQQEEQITQATAAAVDALAASQPSRHQGDEGGGGGSGVAAASGQSSSIGTHQHRSSSPSLASSDGDNTDSVLLEENDRHMAEEVFQHMRLENMKVCHRFDINISTLDAAYHSVILAGATRLSLGNFLEEAECVNAKIEALLRVNQLTKIVDRNSPPSFSNRRWPLPFYNFCRIFHWFYTVTAQLRIVQTKDEVMAIYRGFCAYLEELRDERGRGTRNDYDEYLALIAYAFPDKFV